MASIVINPGALCIELVCGVGETDVVFGAQEIYETWKNWVLAGNAQYLPAMSAVGGEPLGGGERLGNAFFLQAGNGWKICPNTTEPQVRIVLEGNLFSDPAGAQMFDYGMVVSGGQTHIEQRTSALPELLETGTSGLTPSESSKLSSLGTPTETADAVWSKTLP